MIERELRTIRDFIRWGASRFNAAGLCFGHSYDNAIDEATHLVLHALHLPHDLSPVYAGARLTSEEKARVVDLLDQRIRERKPVAYLTGEAFFCGLPFDVDERVLVPRSPFAELIEQGFQPWLAGHEVHRALDLCTGSGCIAIAMAVNFPNWQVDAVDLSADALEIASRNVEHHEVGDRLRLVQSDLFDALAGQRYDLIVSNPPYVAIADVEALPPEYAWEPRMGLESGEDGLDLVLWILRTAPEHLEPQGLLMVEVGASQGRLVDLLPEVPLEWPEFARGGDGIFVVDRETLVEHGPRFAELLAARGA